MQPDFRVFHSLEQARGLFGPSAIAIGNFDGVHRGHQAVLRRCVETAAGNGWKASALTFDPHPAKVLTPARAPRLLSNVEERCQWMRQCGIGQVLVLPFTREFSLFTPEQFVDQALARSLEARAVFVGANFHFGRGKAGNAAILAELGRTYGYTAELVPAVRIRGRLVSSSEIRRLIEQGRAGHASRLLGRPYGLQGSVVPGRGIGRRETVPTLNLASPAEVLPALGVYVSRTVDLDSGQIWESVTNVGVRPTFGAEDHVTVESFLLESPEERPRRIRIDFLKRLRAERRFADAAALRAQILKDVARTQVFHRRLKRWVGDNGRIDMLLSSSAATSEFDI